MIMGKDACKDCNFHRDDLRAPLLCPFYCLAQASYLSTPTSPRTQKMSRWLLRPAEVKVEVTDDHMIFPNTGSSKRPEEDLCNAQSPQAPTLEAETWHIWQVRIGFFAPPATAPFRAGTPTSVICNFSYDCVFWCGDLNFRLEQTRAEIIRYLRHTVTCLFVLPHRRNISITSF